MSLTQFPSKSNSKCRTALVWNCQCGVPQLQPISNLTDQHFFYYQSKLIRDRCGWVYAKKVYFHQYKSQNIETLIARITENTQMVLPGSCCCEMRATLSSIGRPTNSSGNNQTKFCIQNIFFSEISDILREGPVFHSQLILSILK